MGPRGFEPRSPAPKAGILNQAILRTRIENYRTILFKFKASCGNQTYENDGALGADRTRDLLLTKHSRKNFLTLYQLSYQGIIKI